MSAPVRFTWCGEVYDQRTDENVPVVAQVQAESAHDQKRNQTRILVNVRDESWDGWVNTATVTITDTRVARCSRLGQSTRPCLSGSCVHVKGASETWRAWQGTHLGE